MSELSAQQHWILQPLVDVGVADDRLSELVFDLAFAGMVGPGCLTPAHLGALVDGEPAAVRGAWVQVLHRMITVGGELGAPPAGVVRHDLR